jgi:hypothetical protein
VLIALFRAKANDMRRGPARKAHGRPAGEI